MSTGLAPSLMLDLATSTLTDRRRTDRDRDQQALVRRPRHRRARTR